MILLFSLWRRWMMISICCRWRRASSEALWAAVFCEVLPVDVEIANPRDVGTDGVHVAHAVVVVGRRSFLFEEAVMHRVDVRLQDARPVDDVLPTAALVRAEARIVTR